MTKPKLLYIKHAYHSKTKSTEFLVEILSKSYDVSVFDYDPYDHKAKNLSSLKKGSYDVLVLFQLVPPIQKLKSIISFKRGVFFPMYDTSIARNMGRSYLDWISLKNFQIINFSKTAHDFTSSIGLSSHYIQYFPRPIDATLGDEKSLFFWQRRTNINIKTIENLFAKEPLEHIHLHKALDPDETFTPPSEAMSKIISYSSWYEKKEDMISDVKKSALYMAPREREGIGMSFLEAMAMGRCVIAVNMPTMTEYITDGSTGILYEIDSPKPIAQYDIRKIQESTKEYIQNGYQSWLKNQDKILDWMGEPAHLNKMAFSLYVLRSIIRTPFLEIKRGINLIKRKLFTYKT